MYTSECRDKLARAMEPNALSAVKGNMQAMQCDLKCIEKNAQIFQKSPNIRPRIQSCDRKLQRQHCNNLQRNMHGAFLYIMRFLSDVKTLLAAVNSKVKLSRVITPALYIQIYNNTSRLVRFENKNSFFYFEKSLQPVTTLALCLYIM
jgi:hypothetical protein